MKKIVVGITGASGSAYAVKLTEQLLRKGFFVHLDSTDNGRTVFHHETGLSLA